MHCSVLLCPDTILSVNGFIAGATVTLFALAVSLSAEQVFSEEKVPDYTVCALYVSIPLSDIDADDMAGIGEDTCWRDEPIGSTVP